MHLVYLGKALKISTTAVKIHFTTGEHGSILKITAQELNLKQTDILGMETDDKHHWNNMGTIQLERSPIDFNGQVKHMLKSHSLKSMGFKYA